MGIIHISLQGGQPLFDVASYARRGPTRRDRLSPAELALVSRTAHRAPEVVVKVLTKGSTALGAVDRHFGYIGRYGELALETDEGEQPQGRSIGRDLIDHGISTSMNTGVLRISAQVVVGNR